MERLRGTLSPKVVLLLLSAIADLVAFSSCQNLYTFTTTIDIGSAENTRATTDRSWPQPSNTTISISQATTTTTTTTTTTAAYLPAPTTVRTRDELLESAETGYPNQYARPEPSGHHENDEDDDDDPEEPAGHVIPYSVHEDPSDVPTKPEYVAPGLWAKPPPDKDIPLDFVPTKLHAQVRGTHTVKRLPQREAIESAETDEERLNAHRLREVVTNSKVNTIYTEEGYEDSAYDHAGHVRDADFHEGFARKLHDRENDKHGSRSGKRKRVRHRNLVPEEFKEYDEDYQDHLEEGRTREKTSDEERNLIGYDKHAWERSEIDPKLVVANGIRELEEDIEEDAEEAERSTRIYQRQQESRGEADHVGSSELGETHDESDFEDEDNKPATSKKEKKLKLRGEKAGKGRKTSRKSGRKKKLREGSHQTTVRPVDDGARSEVEPETPASPRGFVTNPLNSQLYSIDQTTLRYVAPAFQQFDEPTTISYSQLFWDYFKTRPPTIEPPALVPNSTTLQPRLEDHTPVAVATIDGQGPYLLVTKEETSTSPSTFFGAPAFHPQSLFSDRADLDPSSVRVEGHRPPGRNEDVDYVGVNNLITTSTVATFSSLQPLLLQPLRASTSIENAEYSSSTTTLLDDAASTPAVMTLNFTEEAYSRINDYEANPFFSPILDNSNVAVTQNKFKYRVLVRPTSKTVPKPTAPPQPPHRQTPSPATLPENSDSKRIRDELNAKYTKILDYVKSKHKIKPLAGNKKAVHGLTPLKLPIPRQPAAHPIFSTSRPIANHSSASAESESSFREPHIRKGASRDQHRSRPTDSSSSHRLEPFVLVRPVQLTYRRNLLPVTKLLPPPPLPLPPPLIASSHVTYHSGGQHNDYLPHVPGKPQQQQQQLLQLQKRDHARLRLFPLVPETSWRTRSRRKRSGEDAANESSVDTGGSNESIKESMTKKRHVSPGERRSRGNPKKSGANGSDHQELLNESPRISGDVVDREIAARFNKPEDTSETSKEDKDRGEVEAEVPDFDYVEELAEDSPVEPLTTTEAGVDTNKYPFYNNENVPVASALKYVVDPRTIPRKTSRGMEFYDSRDAYKQCDEVEPDLDEVLPSKEEPGRGPLESPTRLHGLGDKLDCFKAKYFDENPLDSPLFAEKTVEEPTPPTELDPVKFVSKILVLPEENDDYVVPQMSKKPERNGRQWRTKSPQYETHESIRLVSYKNDPNTGRGRNAYLHTVRGSRQPNVATRRLKNRGPRPKSPTTTSTTTTVSSPEFVYQTKSHQPESHQPESHQPVYQTESHQPVYQTESRHPVYQTESYQNQVYEDVMGNIRNMASGYQVHELTTLPPTTQIQTAGSENTPKIVDDLLSLLSEENNTTDAANVTSSNAMSSEIKGLLPPPKYLTPRRLSSYRKNRPPVKNRIPLLRAPNLPRIIAHHHSVKISKRSTRDGAVNSSKSTSDEEGKKTVEKSIEASVVNGNDSVVETTTTTKANSTAATTDLEIEESRLIRTQDQSPLPSTLKANDKKRRRNSTSGDPRMEASPKTVYTIRDRIRYSKPKWDTRGFGKFSANPKTTDVDSRRKEPRYNHLARTKPVVDSRVNSTRLSMADGTSAVEGATSPTKGRENGTTETHHPEEPVAHQSVHGKRIEYPEAEEAERLHNLKFKGNFEENEDEDEEEKKEEEEEGTEKEEETENTTNTYRVHEDVNEDVAATTTEVTSLLDSKEILSFQEYLETDPPGYAETFAEEITTPSSEYRANTEYKSEDSDEKQDKKIDSSKSTAASWENDSSEKTEEQIEVPVKTKKNDDDDDDSEESSSKEEESSKNDQTYTTQPSWIESDKDEKATFYRPFPFTRYRSMIEEDRHEDEDPEEEEGEETSEDYVFPWHSDKQDGRSRRLETLDRFEYPWERRERLSKERRKRRQRAKRFRKLVLGDEEDEEEVQQSKRRERPEYPWERYNVPSKGHVNTRRDVSPRNTDDSGEESNSEEVTFTKFSSRYRANNAEPTIKSSSAQEIGRSIKKLLEDDSDETKEETSQEETSQEEISQEGTSQEIEDHSSAPSQKSSIISRGISRGTLVPEDVTQPPRRKQRRRKTFQYDKDITSSSRVNSKKLRSKDTDDEEGGNKEEGLVKDYLKLGKSNSEDSGSRAETASSQPSDITEKASSTLRKKRRRVTAKNDTTIAADYAPAESFTEATRRKRKKPQVSSTTSAAPLDSDDDLKTSKSDFAHIRRRYSMAGDVVKVNRSNPIEETVPSSTAEPVKGDSAEAETSTPKTRTIEHRSRVSKEKIVTKTTYPNETENFDAAKKNATLIRQEPMKQLKIKVSRRKSNSKRRNKDDGESSGDEKPVKRKSGGGYHDARFEEDDTKRSSVALKKPEAKPLKGFGMRKEEVKKTNNFSTFDEVVHDEDGSDNFGDAMPSETHMISNLLQNIPPSRRNSRVKKKKTTKDDSIRINEQREKQVNSEEKDKDAAKRSGSLLQAKFIKEPERRLYYYVERK